jgi:2'-5' RNA ligase
MSLLDAHFGEVSAALDWRAPEFADESPDDDSELNPTPSDVVGILGFDPREFEGPGDEGKVVLKGEHSGAMVAWMLPPDVAAAISNEGGEDPADMHVTVLYLGKGIEPAKIEALRAALRGIAGQVAPLIGTIGGVGRFPATESSEGRDVIVGLVDVARLEALRERIIAAARACGIEPVLNHGYTPHVTLAYVDPSFSGEKREVGSTPVTISELTLAVAGEREAFPLVGSEVIKAHGGGPCPMCGKRSWGWDVLAVCTDCHYVGTDKNFHSKALRKAASLPPLQRGGPTVDRARRQFQAKLGEFLRDAAAKIARRVLLVGESAEKVSKADAKPKLTPAQIAAMQALQADEVLHIDWDDLIPEAEAALTTIAEAGGYQALAQLEIRDTDVISEVNSIAGKWAHERAAEMVGKKWVDGKLVDNPNAQWAISESTRDSLRSVIEDAFSRNTGMRELSSAIQEAGAFSESRAMMIAKTEALLAENRGNLQGWQAGGVETISWTCSEDHDDNSDCSCLELEENSPYPVDAVPDLPHPGCWCTLSVDRLTGEPAEDDED